MAPRARPFDDRDLAARARATDRRRLLAPLHRALDAWRAAHGGTIGTRSVLAVSGGPDSRALLEAFASWRGRAAIVPVVVSIDHGTTPCSATHAARVVARARVLACEGRVVRVRATKLDEASLRAHRREALVHVAREVGARVIVTAHHADDEAEGALLALLGAGGGPEGAGMGAFAPLDDEGACFVARPLLGLSKSTLALACTGARAFDVVVDERDARGIGARASLRAHLLPLMRGVDGESAAEVVPRMARRARIQREDEMALQALARSLLVDEGTAGLRVQGGPRAAMRRAAKIACARLTGAVVDPRGGARALDAALAHAFVRGDDDRLPGPVSREATFDLAGVTLRVVQGASGRGEFVLVRLADP